ncbi:unnamed protein product [Brachionus calyciflorus]|uniref:Uncharacterized protein n=1 Tax=Brachionus calyciflorus TaxID=104777 RepID=A0A813RSD7_9BILA|nr:unnamed protein product [Brachionus calyciflorus]
MSASAQSSENTVKKIYQTVIDEVIDGIREAFLDEGHDESILQDLKQMWETKLNASRAIQNTEESNDSNLRLPVNKETKQAQHDVKPSIDSATRAAFQALPQSVYGQPEVNQKLKKHLGAQVDGGVDGSSSDEDEDETDLVGDIPGDDDEDDDKNDDPSEYEGKEDSDPLNSEDDLTEPGSPNSNSDLFDTEHVIVCQYDKITRIKNKWKFHLKDGIMNINGKDYLFSKANGDAECDSSENMSSSSFHNRDRVLTSLHNMIEISRNYGFNYSEHEKVPSVDSSSNQLLEILQQIEQNNDSLNQILGEIKQSDLNNLKNSLKQTETLDCKYVLALKSFKNSLKNKLDNLDKILNKINKQLAPGTIKMEFKYQKLAAEFLNDTRNELAELEKNANLYEQLNSFLKTFNFNPEIIKYDLEFSNLYEKLKQSIELLITFHEKFNERSLNI